MTDVWIAGAEMTRIGRRPESLQDLIAEAALAALATAGLERPDAVVVAAMNPEEFVGEGNFASNVASHIGFAEDETPDQWKNFIEINKQFFKDNPGVQPATKS